MYKFPCIEFSCWSIFFKFDPCHCSSGEAAAKGRQGSQVVWPMLPVPLPPAAPSVPVLPDACPPPSACIYQYLLLFPHSPVPAYLLQPASWSLGAYPPVPVPPSTSLLVLMTPWCLFPHPQCLCLPAPCPLPLAPPPVTCPLSAAASPTSILNPGWDQS